MAGLHEKTWPRHLPTFARCVAQGDPQILIDLGCGACQGALAVVERYRGFERLFAIDIDWASAKTADGLFLYIGERPRVDPVVANFWSLPFPDGMADCVFTHHGLDEAREIDLAIAEIARVLRLGGRLVAVARTEPNLHKQTPFLDPFGFTPEEKRQLAAAAHIYAGVAHLCALAEGMGLRTVSAEASMPNQGEERTIFVFEKMVDAQQSAGLAAP